MSTTALPRQVTISKRDLGLGAALKDPELFAQVYLGIELWSKQHEICQSIMKYDRTAVKACHASSKTFTAAVLTLWFIASHDEAIVVTTAPTFNQVQKLLWGEIHSMIRKSRYPFADAKVTQTDLYFDSKRYATGLTTSVTNQDEGVKFQGIHAANVLIILDEAPGVEPKIWEAIEGARAGGNSKILAIGNPTISSGPFHDAFVNNRSGWNCITISAFDTPNLKGLTLDQLVNKNDPGYLTDEQLKENSHPYLTTRYWVKEKYFEYGVQHPYWESRVLGQFPSQSEDSLYSLAWLEAAKNRALEPDRKDTVVAGLDVAGPGNDETVLTVRQGPKILLHKAWPSADPRGQVVAALNPFKRQLKAVNIDKLGIGWGMYVHLKELGFPAVGINITETSYDSEKFANSRAEFCWGLRLRLEAGELSGLTDEKAIGQLAGMRWRQNARGQTEIESKDQAAKRGVKSPDRAESIILAFAERSRAYSAIDYYKGNPEYMNKIQASTMIKPAIAENSQKCPFCEATCVVKCGGDLRCNQCGKQWNQGGNLGQKPSDMQKAELPRSKYLAGLDAKNKHILSWR